MTPLLASTGLSMLLLALVFFLLFSTLASRPLKKQAEQQARLRDGLTEGTRVVLTSGLFGTITHVGQEQLIIELSPGVEVTALKTAVTKVVGSDDEEFEFADDDADEFETADQADLAAAGRSGASAAPAPVTVTHPATVTEPAVVNDPAEEEPTSDAASMENAAPGTQDGLGFPAEAERTQTTSNDRPSA